MSWLSAIGRLFSPPPQRTRARKPSAAGNFFANWGGGGGRHAAGTRDRLTEDWSPQALSPSTIHRLDADLMRNRARDLLQSNPYALGGVRAYTANVIGSGITPKPRFDSPDERKPWMDSWNWWAGQYENEADITGVQHLYELQALWLEEVIVGGGCLVIYRSLAESFGRSLPLALELVPEERFANSKDDLIGFQNRKKSGNRIVRGVELDSATGKQVAYWIYPHSVDAPAIAEDPVRISAENARYSFIRRRVGQHRGTTWLHAAIMWLWKIGYYVDNELMASAIKSCYAAVIETENGDDYAGLHDDDDSTLTDVSGNPLERLSPGLIARLKRGESIKGVGPNNPGGDQTPWIILIQRAISLSLDHSYEEHFRDYSQGNFSSTRASANADRIRYRCLQQFTVNHFCAPTYAFFARAAVLHGLQGFPSIDDFAANYRLYLGCTWRRPGWASVNPIDDVNAAILECKAGFNTRENVAAERGRDWEEIDEQRDREQDSATSRGLIYTTEAGDPADSGQKREEALDQQTPQRGGGKRQPAKRGNNA
jgi:lambda family phage portal protein